MNAVAHVRLDELVTITGGGTPSRSNPDFFNGDIPWVTPKDMKSPELRDSLIRLTELGLRESAARLVPSDSVLVVVRSGVLKHSVPIAINRVPVALNQDMKALSAGSRLLPEYLAHYLRAASPVILRWVRATTADNFPLEKLRDLRVPLPDLGVQRRIAHILNQAEAARAYRGESIRDVEDLTRSIFLEMFGGLDSNQGQWLKVTDLATGRDAIRTGPFGSQLLHSEFQDEGIAVLGIDSVVANEFRWVEGRCISEAKYRQLRRYTVRPGDVVITIMGTCGRCAIVPDGLPTAINTKHLCCITLDTTKCLPEFLQAYFLWHPVARRYLERAAKGAIMSGLNMGIIKALPVPVVPLEEQAMFVSRREACGELRSQLRSSLRGLHELFESLRQRAFAGEL